jgi:hypothetical protein
LVRRQDTKHKWIYYELTDKGATLFRPKIPFQLILSLALAIIITGISGWSALFSPQYDIGSISSAAPEVMKGTTAAGAYAAESSQSVASLLTDTRLPFGIIAAAGLITSITLIYMIYRMTKRR